MNVVDGLDEAIRKDRKKLKLKLVFLVAILILQLTALVWLALVDWKLCLAIYILSLDTRSLK